ncbi:MAG TPA: hypothetical protein VGJ01_15455 [Pseudolabrys sp.]|jgi:hypothetical protein
MLDIVGAIFATAVYATVVGVLIGLSQARPAAKLAAFAFAAAWLALIVAAAGGFDLRAVALGPVPVNLLPFVALVALLFGAWFLIPQVRSALLSLPLSALVALNITRVAGIFFVLLYAQGRLSAPFAPSAGWGDVITGLAAIPLVLMMRAQSDRAAVLPIALWNAFGTLDLVVAISLGIMSAPGTPFRIFTDEPGTLAMTQLPWIMIPTMLVPIYLLIHLAVATKLRELSAAAQRTQSHARA